MRSLGSTNSTSTQDLPMSNAFKKQAFLYVSGFELSIDIVDILSLN